MKKVSPPTAECPECHESIAFGHEPLLNHLLLCPHCEMILAVVGLRPLQLDWAFEEPISPDDPTFPILPYKPNWHFGAEH